MYTHTHTFTCKCTHTIFIHGEHVFESLLTLGQSVLDTSDLETEVVQLALIISTMIFY